MGDLDTLVAVAKMAELVTEPELRVYQDVRRVRIERENSFALSCELAGARSVPACWVPSGAGGMGTNCISRCCCRMDC